MEIIMRFNFNDDFYAEDPTLDLVREYLELLEHDQYVILGRGEGVYVQVYLHDDDSFQLEYRHGSADKHFEASDEMNFDAVEQVFVRFHSMEEGWETPWVWQQVNFSDVEVAPVGELTSHDGWVINGEEYRKIAVGNETATITGEDGKCKECGISAGSFHSPSCDSEECPCCQGWLTQCDCE